MSSCAAETLNTLKFAQRAKLIQNNVSLDCLILVYVAQSGNKGSNYFGFIPIGCDQ